MHIFRKHIIRPIEMETSGILQNLRLLLDSICLRRTKELLNLSEPIEKYHLIDLSAAEEHVYFETGENSRTAIDRAVCGHDTVDAYSSVLQALVRLRLLCNNGTLEHPPVDHIKVEYPDNTNELLVLLQQGDQAVYAHGTKDASPMGESDASSPNLLATNHYLLLPDLFEDVGEDSEQNSGNASDYAVEQQFPGNVRGRKHSLPIPSLIPVTSSMSGGYSSKLSAVLSELEKTALEDKRLVPECYDFSSLIIY